jgi:sigma-E factor negative regulatory protein RseC
MIEETAVVARIEAGQVWVVKEQKSACGSCTQACTASIVGTAIGAPKERELAVSSLLELEVGDRVIVGVREDLLVKGLLSIYLVPLLGLFVGAVVGGSIGVHLFEVTANSASALGGGTGLLATVFFLKCSRMLASSRMQPVVLRKLI